MKIIIDTKVDSKEDIQKAIKFLESISSGGYERVSNVAEEKPGMFNMFGSESSGNANVSETLNSPSVEPYGNSDVGEEKSETFNVKDMLEEY